MSAVTSTQRDPRAGGIRRYRTRWKVLVKSHSASLVTIDLSDMVVNISMSKNIKSVGSLSMALTAERNVLNLVNPNDYISVYCDRGDGEGWTRVFLGFIDHINETRRVDSGSGKPSTIYSLQCSDFQKAFERTEIYFNPYVAARGDFNGSFVGTVNVGGSALRTIGLRVLGTPADLVLSTVLLLMGFGSQFVLPNCYRPRVMDRVRADRANFILGQLSEDVRRQILDQGGYRGFLESIRSQGAIRTDIDDLTIDPFSVTSEASAITERARDSQEIIRRLAPGSDIDSEEGRSGTELGTQAFNILNTTLPGYPPTLLDIMDIFTFVEREAIDGYSAELSMWTRQGSVWSFMNSVSNEIVNELFVDLRLVSTDGGLTAGSDFSRDLDDIGGNEADPDTGIRGYQYQPVLVMREYPFSTISRINAENLPLSVRSSGMTGSAPEVGTNRSVTAGFTDEPVVATDTTDAEAGASSAAVSAGVGSAAAGSGISPSVTGGEGPADTGSAYPTLGTVHFGAIFSNQPNQPGRHVITMPSINPNNLVSGVTTAIARKHLDVAVVEDREIISTNLSRSDTDHFNLFELTSQGGLLGEHSRFFMMDLLPIITPVNIVRHGLRVRSLTTRFARLSPLLANRVTSTVHSTERAAASSAPSGVPAGSPDPGGWRPEAGTTGSTVLPVDLITAGGNYTRGYVSAGNTWRYRRKVYDGVRAVNNTRPRAGVTPYVPTAGTGYWRFHNGVDIVGPAETPVKAVRDGKVVLAAPVGTLGTAGYGNVIVIYHEQDDLFSVYAHLSDIASPFLFESESRNLSVYSSRTINPNGTYAERPVTAGTVIGGIGNTGCPESGPHLHFEFNVRKRGLLFPSSQDRAKPYPVGVTTDIFFIAEEAALAAAAGFPVPSHPGLRYSPPSNPSESDTISQDPVRIFRSFGVELPVGRRVDMEPAGEGPITSDEPDDDYPGDENEYHPEVETSSTPGIPPELPEIDVAAYNTGTVDDSWTRKQLARWALLQDHWFQHNLEYVSGTVEMRGAPEIRAGYRLDLKDRNMSFYVEGVSHNWTYGQPMTTTLHVTRGQPNNPYPVYVLPAMEGFCATETQRKVNSRLASYFVIPDPLSVRRSLKIQRDNPDVPTRIVDSVSNRLGPTTNITDASSDGDPVGPRYNEAVIECDFDSAAAMASAGPELAALSEEVAGVTGTGGVATAGFNSNPSATDLVSEIMTEVDTYLNSEATRALVGTSSTPSES